MGFSPDRGGYFQPEDSLPKNVAESTYKPQAEVQEEQTASVSSETAPESASRTPDSEGYFQPEDTMPAQPAEPTFKAESAEPAIEGGPAAPEKKETIQERADIHRAKTKSFFGKVGSFLVRAKNIPGNIIKFGKKLAGGTADAAFLTSAAVTKGSEFLGKKATEISANCQKRLEALGNEATNKYNGLCERTNSRIDQYLGNRELGGVLKQLIGGTGLTRSEFLGMSESSLEAEREAEIQAVNEKYDALINKRKLFARIQEMIAATRARRSAERMARRAPESAERPQDQEAGSPASAI